MKWCAVFLIVEPIFEADFHDCSYGFRPNRGAQQAGGFANAAPDAFARLKP